MAEKDLGPVSAYALAVEHGFVGTEQEWAQAQIDAAENGRKAMEAASNAEAARGAAVTAQGAAEAAAKRAEDAAQGITPGSPVTPSAPVLTAETINERRFKLHYLGPLYEAPDNYVAWGGDLMYEPSLGKFMQWLYCTNKHIHQSSKLYVVRIDKQTMIADAPVRCKLFEANGETPINLEKEAGVSVRRTETGDLEMFKNIDGTFYRFRTPDYGTTWIKNGTIKSPAGGFDKIVVLSNGRYITSYGGPMFYSDDKGANWTTVRPATAGGDYEAEAFFCELKPGTVMALARYSMGGNAAGNGTPDPAIVAYSYDYGTTWTPWKKSKTILDMNAMGCTGFIHDGFLELYVTSRWYDNITNHTNTGLNGVVHQYVASIDSALEDNFTDLGVVYEAQAAYAEDFLSPECALDDAGDMLMSLPDGGGTVQCEKKYIKGTRVSSWMLLDDDNPSLFRVYSSAYMRRRLQDLDERLLSLQQKVAEIPGSGVTPPAPSPDTALWTKVYESSDGYRIQDDQSPFKDFVQLSGGYGAGLQEDSLGYTCCSTYPIVIPANKANFAIETTETIENSYNGIGNVGIFTESLDCKTDNYYANIISLRSGAAIYKDFVDFQNKGGYPQIVTRRVVFANGRCLYTLIANEVEIVHDYDITDLDFSGLTLLDISTPTQKCAFIPKSRDSLIRTIKFGEWD